MSLNPACDPTDAPTPTQPANPPIERLPAWVILAGGMALGMLLFHAFFVAPTFSRLESLQTQVTKLNDTIGTLTDCTGDAQHAASLLAALKNQREFTAEAAESLASIRSLEARVLQESHGAQLARQTLDNVRNMSQAIVQSKQLFAQAKDAFAQLFSLQQRLVDQQSLTNDAWTAMTVWAVQRDRAMELHAQSGVIDDALEDLAVTHDQIAGLYGDSLAIKDTLNQFVEIASLAELEGRNVADARQSLTELIWLKDQIHDQAANLAEAVETFEVLTDVRDQIDQLADNFLALRTRINEITGLEVPLRKALDILSPLMELTNLRRLSAADLRNAARAVVQSRSQNLAPIAEESPQSSSVPQTVRRHELPLDEMDAE